MSRFWVKKVEDLVPYVPGEQPISRSLVKLNTNEHALEPSAAVMAAIADMQADQLRRYPDPLATDSGQQSRMLKGFLHSRCSSVMALMRCWPTCG